MSDGRVVATSQGPCQSDADKPLSTVYICVSASGRKCMSVMYYPQLSPLVGIACVCSWLFLKHWYFRCFCPKVIPDLSLFWVVKNALGFAVRFSSFLHFFVLCYGHRQSQPLLVYLLRLVSHVNSGVCPEMRCIFTKRASFHTSNISSLWGFS